MAPCRSRNWVIASVALLLVVGVAPTASAQPDCRFVLGFQALHDQIPGIVGDCLENERFNPLNGNAEQRTTGGLLVWRQADNWTAFTDGATTWINGPYGLVSRPNEGPLFSWEAGAPAPAQPPAPAAVLAADNFDDAVAGILPVTSNNPILADRGYLEGEYVIRKNDPRAERAPISRVPGTFADSSLMVDARIVGPTEGRVIMLGCRAQLGSDSHYRLGVRPATGSFELVRWDGQVRVPLVDFQVSPAIRPGNATNRLELRCDGPDIAALVNGVQVAALRDATYPTGQVWIGASDLEWEPVPVDVRFDNLVVTAR